MWWTFNNKLLNFTLKATNYQIILSTKCDKARADEIYIHKKNIGTIDYTGRETLRIKDKGQWFHFTTRKGLREGGLKSSV